MSGQSKSPKQSQSKLTVKKKQKRSSKNDKDDDLINSIADISKSKEKSQKKLTQPGPLDVLATKIDPTPNYELGIEPSASNPGQANRENYNYPFESDHRPESAYKLQYH